MRTFTAAEIAALTEGKLLCGDPDTVITNIQYDSRQVREGSLFVPIRGARTDPHIFMAQCFEQGAAAALTEQPVSEEFTKPCILVKNTLAALQKLAGAYRQSLSLTLVGVTGSVGKTSTKEMIAAALSQGLDVMKTQGNKNSQIGLPMTMFEMEPHHEAAVIEMGMSEFGEMDRLCDIARPCMAVMTNIGKAHIENLKTQENILAEKLKITRHFDRNGVLFLNGDDRLLSPLYHQLPFSTVTFGLDSGNDYYAEDISVNGFSTEFVCRHGDQAVRLCIPAMGVHSIMNALAAFAVAQHLGLTEETIRQGLLTYRNAPMRQQIHECRDFVLIDDSYNASPEATKASLDVLRSAAGGSTIAVLADMLELGEEGEGEHYRVGAHLAEIGIDMLLTVGPLSRHTARGAGENGCSQVFSFDSNDEAFDFLCGKLTKGCTVLVKGSRGMHTDEIVKKLLQAFPEMS